VTVRDPWKTALAEAYRDPDELVNALRLPESLREPARRAASLFPLVAPRDFVGRMRIGDPADPLLRQVLPLGSEELETPGYGPDPVGDRQATRAEGLIHKYHGRVLLMASGACAVHCRYCFRREYPYAEGPRGIEALGPALGVIRSDSSIEEVILSGGDPLLLTDAALGRVVRELEAMPHLRRLRIHTRVPIVIPERTTAELRELLRTTRLTPIFVVHVNHPNELAGGCVEALASLVDDGIPVLNQAVLLRGVNDDAETMIRLCAALVDLRVMPYYLHQLDRVRGTAHFWVDETRGLEIMQVLRSRLPGYALPRYVREIAGRAAKIDVGLDVESVPMRGLGG
jgi:EF-P beta-lysylation protein EpmB